MCSSGSIATALSARLSEKRAEGKVGRATRLSIAHSHGAASVLIFLSIPY